MRIVAIDPGTSATGLVYMDENGVVCCKTLRGNPVKQDQYALMARASHIADQITGWIADKEHGAVVIEGFTSFGGLRQSSNTYQTPYLVGYLQAVLREENIVIQTSRQVLNPHMRGNLSMVRDMAAKGVVVFPGSGMCTNDHLRSAMCHGIYYMKCNLGGSCAAIDIGGSR